MSGISRRLGPWCPKISCPITFSLSCSLRPGRGASLKYIDAIRGAQKIRDWSLPTSWTRIFRAFCRFPSYFCSIMTDVGRIWKVKLPPDELSITHSYARKKMNDILSNEEPRLWGSSIRWRLSSVRESGGTTKPKEGGDCQSLPTSTKAELKVMDPRGRTPICGFLLFLRSSSDFCEDLRSFLRCSATNMLCFLGLWEKVNRQVSKPVRVPTSGNWKISTTTTQRARKENLQRETLSPSNPTVDMEMLEKLAKPYLPWRFSGLSRPFSRRGPLRWR